MHQAVVNQTDMLLLMLHLLDSTYFNTSGDFFNVTAACKLNDNCGVFYCRLTFSMAFHNQLAESLNSSKTVTQTGKDSSKRKM